MSKQLLWIIGGLALLIVGFVALQIYLHVDMKQFKEELADPEPKTDTETEQPPEQVQVPEVDNRPPQPDDGREYVWHGDHWHEVPIAQNDAPPYKGTLTYHSELLKTNPVKALRLQSEERGHWSAKWIPPFPPDDQEAAEIARARYLLIYYETIGDTDNPEYKKANSAALRQAEPRQKIIREAYTANDRDAIARICDLMKLIWPHFPESDVPPLYEKGWRTSPSDYFPVRIEDLKHPLSNPK